MKFQISYFSKEEAQRGGMPFHEETINCLNEYQAWAIADEQKALFGENNKKRGDKDIIIELVGWKDE